MLLPFADVRKTGGRAFAEVDPRRQLRACKTGFRVVAAANLESDRENRQGGKAHGRTRECKAGDDEGKNHQAPKASFKRGGDP
ncbi:hypothetical protein [Bradyrhizobium sp.]|uniref:hypothetical protein n=1 Tax=Bradyrhizobium sp. TaxID=376 RepID=UPI003C1A73FC